MSIKCLDCGSVFEESLNACPVCGCPASYCATNSVEPETQASETENSSLNISQNIASKESFDWANYIYECGVLFWQTFTRRYAKFSGRASRREFWSFTIISVLFGWSTCIGLLILPTIAVSIRRMHDINKSGWWSICPIASLFLFLKRSDRGENKYGFPMNYDNLKS